MATLVPAAVYLLIARYPLLPTLAGATLLWLVTAAILVTVWLRLHPTGS